jgi:uncharacterized protein YqgC (DUF456 family)
MSYLIWAAGIAAILIGFLGTVLPALPGTPLIFLGIWLIAWWTDYMIISGPTLLALAFLSIAGFIVDVVASALGAKRVGASGVAIAGATAGSLIGILFALPGMIIGPFIGAALGQYYHDNSLHRATKVGIGTWLGMVVGTVAKLAIAVSMVLTFLTALAV